MVSSGSEMPEGGPTCALSGSSSEGSTYVPSVGSESSESILSSCSEPYIPPPPDAFSVDCTSLPPRLFATDMYPSDGRVNSYSKLQYLIDLVDIFHGTSEMQTLLASQFGHLFRLPTARCSLSGKLVHNMLCRQIVSHNPHETWFTFGGQPFRFSITEFEYLTGLNCAPYPSRPLITERQTPPHGNDWYWFELFGDAENITISKILSILRSTPKLAPSRRIRLALIVIVEGILLCRTQPVTPSFQTVEMIRDISFFLNYPWGRQSFMLTLRMMKVGVKVASTEKLVNKLKQSSVALHGFPLAIQLLVFKSIPALLEYLPRAFDASCFLDRRIELLPQLKTYHTGNILELENRPKIRVIPCLCNTQKYPIDLCSDHRIFRLHNLICRRHRFSKSDWVGGDASLERLCLCSSKGNRRCRCSVHGTSDPPSPPLPFSSASPSSTLSDDCAQFTATVSRLASVQTSLSTDIKLFIRQEFVSFRDSVVQKVLHMARTRSGQSVPSHGSEHVAAETSARSGSNETACSASSSLSVRSVPRTGPGLCSPNLSPTGLSDARESGVKRSVPRTGPALCSPKLSPTGVADARESGVKRPPYSTRQHTKVLSISGTSPLEERCGDSSMPLKRFKSGSVFETAGSPSSCFCPFRIPSPDSINFLRAKQATLQSNGDALRVDGQVVSSTFFGDIGTPQHWLSNSHIDLIIRTVWRARSHYFLANRMTVTDCFFTRYLKCTYAAFSNQSAGTFKWPNVLRDYVLGHVLDRSEVAPWFRAVRRIYAPMNWGAKHWVALVIHLDKWHVDILDPLVSLTSDRGVRSHMRCVLTMLPCLLRAFSPSDLSSNLRPTDFTFWRLSGVSQNERSGDCGPLVVKFIELHSHKYKLSGITDEMVNALRWDYAIAVHTAFLGPLP